MFTFQDPVHARVRTPSHLSTCVVDATYIYECISRIYRCKYLTTISFWCHWTVMAIGADLIRCCNISRQPTSLGKMALTVRGALHTYIYAKSFLSGPCPIPPDKLCPTAIRPCWPGAGFAIRALTKDIGEGVCASIVPGVQAHFIHHEPICTTRPM